MSHFSARRPTQKTREEINAMENEEVNIEEMDQEELLNNYQVVRREFFAHTFEAAVSFRYDSLFFNSAAVNKMDTMSVQILINPKKKKMVIKMCDPEAKHAAKWCKIDRKTSKRVPRRMTARMFCAKLYDMMEWAPENRYKIQGIVMKCEDEIILVFDLEETEIFIPRKKGDDEATRSNRSYFPEGWRESFGITYGEFKKSVGVNVLDGFALMEVVMKKERTPKVPEGFELVKSTDPGDNGNGTQQ